MAAITISAAPPWIGVLMDLRKAMFLIDFLSLSGTEKYLNKYLNLPSSVCVNLLFSAIDFF